MDKAFATDFGDASNLYGNQFNPSGNGAVPPNGMFGDASGGDDAAIEFPDELNTTPMPNNNNTMNPAQMNNAMLMQQQQQYAAQFNPMLAAGYTNQFQMNPQLFMSQMTPQQRQYLQQQQYMMMQHQQRLLMAHQQQAAQSAAMLQAANANAAASVPPTPTPAPTTAPPTPAAPTATWQSPNDNPSRREVITRIIHFLQSQKPNAPPDWMRRLPQMAKKLEESLYRNAASKAEYMDPNTLKQRLQVVARSFHTMKQATATPATAAAADTNTDAVAARDADARADARQPDADVSCACGPDRSAGRSTHRGAVQPARPTHDGAARAVSADARQAAPPPLAAAARDMVPIDRLQGDGLRRDEDALDAYADVWPDEPVQRAALH